MSDFTRVPMHCKEFGVGRTWNATVGIAFESTRWRKAIESREKAYTIRQNTWPPCSIILFYVNRDSPPANVVRLRISLPNLTDHLHFCEPFPEEPTSQRTLPLIQAIA